jgi:hypothetical protein
MGRSLLTLLVVTGLAGTIKDTSLSKHERKMVVDLMKDTKTNAINSVKKLSDAQQNYKTAPERWSAKECMYHIAGAEKMLWQMLEKAMKEPANPGKRSEIKITDEELIKSTEDRTNKLQAPEPIQPKNTGFATLDVAIDDFKSNRLEHIKYLKNTTEDLRDHVVQMPFGWIDCYQLCLLIAAHSNRHTQQIDEVKAAPGFPKK